MSKSDIVSNHDQLYPPIKAMIIAIGGVIKMAPVSLRASIRMAAAHELLNLESTNEAREVLASVYHCFTLNNKED